MELTAPAGAGGFSVRAGDLAAGSGQMLAQPPRYAQLTAAATGLITQMAGTAEHPGLTGALVTAPWSRIQACAVAGPPHERVAGALRRSPGPLAAPLAGTVTGKQP